VYSTASEVKDEFDRFIHVSKFTACDGRTLTLSHRAHRPELGNKRPYSGGLNRPSKRTSPSSPAWPLTYSVSHRCPRRQSESSRARDGRSRGTDAVCLRIW
jgi:hypothetical protein